jgi:hypothetical protein
MSSDPQHWSLLILVFRQRQTPFTVPYVLSPFSNLIEELVGDGALGQSVADILTIKAEVKTIFLPANHVYLDSNCSTGIFLPKFG